MLSEWITWDHPSLWKQATEEPVSIMTGLSNRRACQYNDKSQQILPKSNLQFQHWKTFQKIVFPMRLHEVMCQKFPECGTGCHRLNRMQACWQQQPADYSKKNKDFTAHRILTWSPTSSSKNSHNVLEMYTANNCLNWRQPLSTLNANSVTAS